MTTRALAQTYEPNPLLAYVYRRFFEHIQVDETWVAAVREAAARGSSRLLPTAGDAGRLCGRSRR